MTAGIHINWASNKHLRKRILRCPTDECRTEFVVRFEAYHGCTWMCCRCGDSWVDEGMRPRPFERDWRRKQVACLLITGSRQWTDRARIVAELDTARHELGDDTILVHGDARGVDRIAAHLWGCEWGLPVEDHPADWRGPCRPECKPHHRRAKASGLPKVCPAAEMYRNADMVALGADLCLAFILDDSRGATGCARLARKAGIPVRPFRATSAVAS